MKVNQPVTGVEIPLQEDTIIVSTTDLKGMITSANGAFIEISGFSEAELLGRNHNIVRHPDVPAAAFQDLWDTIKKGHPWTGIVKNRAKSGDHYWVKANVTPIYQNGQVVEYMSVRTKPTAEEVEGAEVLYRAINSGSYKGDGWLTRGLKGIGNLPLLKKFYLVMLFMAVSFLISGVAAWSPMQHAEVQWHNYQEQVAERQTLLSEMKSQLGYGGAIHNFKNYVLRGQLKYAERFRGNYQKLLKLLDQYAALASVSSEEQQALSKIRSVADSYAGMIDQVVSMSTAGESPTAIDGVVKINDQPALEGLETLKMEYARLTSAQTAELESTIGFGKSVSALMPPVGFVMLFVIFFLVLKRAVLNPIEASLGYFRRIAEGHFSDDIELRRGDEIGDLYRGIKIMQTKVGFDVNDARERAESVARIKTALDNVSSCVMMADNERNIVYMNKTVRSLFEVAEADIRSQLPEFDASKLMGTNIDLLYKHSDRQAKMLEGLTKTYRSELRIGGRTMGIIANPVLTEDGRRLGTAVEWSDRTSEVAVEDELENIVAAALHGDLSRRVSLEGKTGFFSHLAKGINALIDQMSRVFDDVASTMKRVKEGDLSEGITHEYSGTFGEIKEAVNESTFNLNRMIAQLREATDSMIGAAGEISSGNSNLSARTEQQASSLQETAASMEELTSTVRNNADNAQQANQLAMRARSSAERGGAVVQNAIHAMDEINQSSNKISEIIGVIDEIAFQTNLLALNASVEAARAGEQGRGFAVVATEVRNLAGRSATAAKEIKNLIKDSAAKVESGASLVNESGSTLEEIVSEVKKVGDIVSEIAAASLEQSEGIEQVNQAVTNMDELTQQNAALAEQTSSTAVAMSEKAQDMERLIRFFNLENKHSGGACEAREEDSFDFHAARAAHLSWKMRLRDFLDGKKSMHNEEAVSHRDCALGKWLYGFAMDEYGYIEEMQVMEKLHEKMHSVIKDVVSLRNAGDDENAEAAFAEVGPLSDEIIHLLKRVEAMVEE